MAHRVKVASGLTNIQLPNGLSYNAGQVANLTDDQFAQLPTSLFPATLIDLEPGEAEVFGPAPSVAANADATTDLLNRVPYTGRAIAATYVPANTITGANTDTRRLDLVNTGQDGAGTTVVASLQFNSGINAAAHDEKAITLHATATNRNVTAGDILQGKSVHVGSTGLADPGGEWLVDLDETTNS